MARDGTGDIKFLIYALIYSNKLAYLQLITALVYGNSPPKSHEKVLAKILKYTCK